MQNTKYFFYGAYSRADADFLEASNPRDAAPWNGKRRPRKVVITTPYKLDAESSPLLDYEPNKIEI